MPATEDSKAPEKKKRRFEIHVKLEPRDAGEEENAGRARQRGAPKADEKERVKKAKMCDAAAEGQDTKDAKPLAKGKESGAKNDEVAHDKAATGATPKEAGKSGVQDREEAAEVQTPPMASPSSEEILSPKDMTPEKLAAAKAAGLDVPPELASGQFDIKEMLADAAKKYGRSTKALKEAFKRSLPDYQDPRTSDVEAHSRNQKVPKMDAECAKTMLTQNDRDWWFGVWIANNAGWLKAESIVEDLDQEIEIDGKSRRWLIEAEMMTVYKDAEFVAEYQQ